MPQSTIAIIGAGNMGASLIKGLIANGYPSDQLWVSDPSEEKLTALSRCFSIPVSASNETAITAADIIIFAIKPQLFSEVVVPLKNKIREKTPLVISIAAGIRAGTIQEWLGGNISIVRAMPNLPATVGSGATALLANEFVSETEKQQAESILRAVGMTVWLQNEKEMDAVTALSGSGPAYFFYIIEILENVGRQLGLAPETAKLLSLQTAYGAAKLALESPDSMAQLRKQVTSKGGTTEAAMTVLEEENIARIFAKALGAAKERAEALAESVF